MYGGVDMNDFTFLTKEQVFGDDKIDIISKYGEKCAPTDFSVLLGGMQALDDYTEEGYRAGCWWTKHLTWINNGLFVSAYIGGEYSPTEMRNVGARPAISYSSIQSDSLNKVRGANGIMEVEYGEYPQTIVDENYSRELERAYNNGSLKITGKRYTTDSVYVDEYDTNFVARAHIECEYNGNKYICIAGDSDCSGRVLSDGRTIKTGELYWLRVEPITWLVDEKENIALSKKIIFSGVQFNNHKHATDDFNKTDIKQFMDNYFSKEIVADRVYSETTSVEQVQDIGDEESIRKSL